MDVNQLAEQLNSLLATAYSQPITMDLSTDIEPAGVRAGLAHEFLEVLVEEICAYGEVGGILIWTEQAETEEAERSQVNLGIEIYSSQVTVPEPKTKNLRELSDRLRGSGCVLRLRAVTGRWIRHEILFPTEKETDRGIYVSGRGETVLLVEDEDTLRNVTTQVLESCGYRVLAARNVKTAMDIFALHRGRINLLLTDLDLEGDNGAELAENLSSSDPRLKVILMSGYPEREIIGHEFGDTDMAYLSKPFSVESLIGKVWQVIRSPLVEEIGGTQVDNGIGTELR